MELKSHGLFLGIDPGVSGAMTLIDSDGAIWAILDHRAPDRDCFTWLQRAAHHIQYAVIENVHSMPGQGVSSVFKFGTSYGKSLMLLAACNIEYASVTPQVWQGRLGCMTKGHKNITKQMAQGLWPDRTITHQIADSMLIAEFARWEVLKD